MPRTLRLLPTAALLLASVSALSAVLAAPPGGGKQKQDISACLVRPADAPDADAKGSLRLRTDEKKGAPRHRLDLKAQKLGTAVEHTLWMENGDVVPVLEQVGTLTKSGKTLKYSLDTSKGDELPFAAAEGVDELSDLAGRAVEVRAGGDVVLHGTMPAFQAKQKPKQGKDKLDPSAGSPDGDAKGDLRVDSKNWKCEEAIEVKVQKLDFADGPFRVRIEDAAGSGTFLDAGGLDQLGKSANGRYRRRTKDGDALPGGVSTVAELQGRLLQVGVQVDETTFTSYLEVEVPQLK